ncbi:MAG: response regulator transcription factor [Anaerolineales bacterium]|nr:MAG: response regulator transcription factor [Anaerolineales bacterium]
MKKIRILVVDDESVVREGVVTILTLQPDIEVIGQGKNGVEAVKLAKEKKPDVVLLDLVMPIQDGLVTIPILKELFPKIKILVLTSFAESNRVYQAIKSGAMGFLLKDATRAQLLEAIHEVAAGKAVIQPSIALKVINEISNPSELFYTSHPLTPRELETLRLIARGLNNHDIATALFVHERTVAKHVTSILEKLQLANRTQAALYAIREGLTDDLETRKRQTLPLKNRS